MVPYAALAGGGHEQPRRTPSRLRGQRGAWHRAAMVLTCAALMGVCALWAFSQAHAPGVPLIIAPRVEAVHLPFSPFGNQLPALALPARPLALWWLAPFQSTSGLGTEAISIVTSLLDSGRLKKEDLWLTQSGEPRIAAAAHGRARGTGRGSRTAGR
jgi:hypothetical protein